MLGLGKKKEGLPDNALDALNEDFLLEQEDGRVDEVGEAVEGDSGDGKKAKILPTMNVLTRIFRVETILSSSGATASMRSDGWTARTMPTNRLPMAGLTF